MKRFLCKIFGLSLLITLSSVFSGWDILKWCLAITGILLVALLIVWCIDILSMDKDQTEKNGYIVYWDQECEPALFWAHNDGISSIAIYYTSSLSLSEESEDINTNEGWAIVSRDSKEEGLYLEDEEITESRNNGMTFLYHVRIKDNFTWLLQNDLVRLLFDKLYFESMLEKAINDDADAQTLIGCCYGHTCKNSSSIVEPNIETALEWWHKAADQGHKYAMRELAIYHWKKGEKDKATYWWNKGKLDLFIIGRENNYQYSDVDDAKEV